MKSKSNKPQKKKYKRSSDPTVTNYVESFFVTIRYSKEVVEAKAKIIKTLEPVYETMKEENENDAFRDFVAKYPDLDALLASAGIDVSKSREWRERKANVRFDDFHSQFSIKRKRIWLTVLPSVLAVCGVPVALIYSGVFVFPVIVLSAALFTLALFFAIKFRDRSSEAGEYSVDGFEKAKKLFDRYTRKSINWFMLLFLELFVTAFEIVSLRVNSKEYEITEHLVGYIILLAAIAFFFIKNLLIVRWLLKKVDYENKPKYVKEFLKTAAVTVLYWAAAFGLYFTFEYLLAKDISAVFFIAYALMILAFNLL
ncbi:MAG: hypothetical protein J5940_05175, partial [Clostridia bacterium]|nr:hypothetical protein [Clostridia bacterium]